MEEDLKARILEVMKPFRLTSLATVTDEGNPWVRYVMTRGNDDMKLRTATFVNARKVAQINRNPEVHLTTGITNPMVVSPYLQIQGRAFLTKEEVERHAFWDDILAPIFSGPDDPKYGILIVVPYRIEYCVPGTFEPEVWTG